MKVKYKIEHEKHEIHKVDYNRRIVLEEVNIEDFAVELMMSDPKPAMETFRGELERYLEQLEGMRGFDIKMSDLIDEKNRITFVSAVAGSGKSVLVKQLVYKWACGELFKEFKLCIAFECRQLNYFVQNEGADLKKHELMNKFINSRFSFDFENAESVLFIVDGLDELCDSTENDSIIGQLLDLKKSKYPSSKIIITGRPHIENMLLRHQFKSIGGLRKVEIRGLSENQIEECIRKFASSNDDMIERIIKAKNSSKRNLKLLHIPQMLQSFCCVIALSELEEFKNGAELYCWSFYLLLKQHAEKDGPCDKKIGNVFNEYSKDLLVLSKICHELLNRNTIIFEGNTEFDEIGKGKEFLEGLFVDVSDNFHTKKQFKHLTLMEFLSAVYVSTIENPTEIIKDILKKRLYQVLLFNCELISGLMYDGIIKEMFRNAANLKEIDCYDFFCNILNLVRECFDDDTIDDDVDEPFKLSIDIIMCLMNKDFICKQFFLSIVNQLSFKNVSGRCKDKLIEMMKGLMADFECSDFELKKAFESVHFRWFEVNELNGLKYSKFLASADLIGLNGRMTTITMTVRDIRKAIDGLYEWVKFRCVSIVCCKLQDEHFENEIAESSKLQELQIYKCNVTEQSLFNLCKWIISSLVEELILDTIEDMKVEWWKVLVDAIVHAKEMRDGDLALRKLRIRGCPVMNDEMKKKVTCITDS